MLFVHDDQPRRSQRREHGRPRADDDVDVAAPDALPLIVTLAVGEPAVLDRDAVAERPPECHRDSRRQRDLRDEQQHAAPHRPNALRQPQIDLGLAAARHAVQHNRLKRSRLRQRRRARERRGLFARQNDGRSWNDASGGDLERVALDSLPART